MLETIWVLSSCVLIFLILIRIPESDIGGIQELDTSNTLSRSEATIFSDPLELITWIFSGLFFILTSLFVLYVN